MSDYDVNQMDLKRLRNEVQLLRDELAIMRRKYEDILYNLDDDNFSSQLKKEKDGMKASIKITEEQIETKVSKDELESTISQTADEIKSTVNDFKNTLSSEITQTASGLSSRVGKVENGKFCDGEFTLFEQTADGFKLTGDVKITEIAQVGKDLYLGDSTTEDERRHIYFNNRAFIANALDGFGYNGIMVSAASLYLIRPDFIYLVNPNNTSVNISLADYISENGGGGTAKFA